jgi:nudix-type nucleoside diphosphatase (YffH/AdpP family)
MQKILSEKVVFNHTLTVVEAEVSNGKTTFERSKLRRVDAAVVLVHNTETDKIILTTQFRYAIYEKAGAGLWEIVAGKLDENEDPKDAAVRETFEEVGYRIDAGKLEHIATCFVSPGYSEERFYIYYATVTSKDRVHEGGGLVSENEDIQVVEINTGDFLKKLQQKELFDSKTVIAAMWLEARLSTS